MSDQKMEGLKLKYYSFLKRLGSGALSVVYEAINERDGSTVAIKTISRKQIISWVEESIFTEIRVMRAISQKGNENVVRFIDNFMSEKCLFIVMEYCNGGDLQQELQRKKVFTEEKATGYLKQILNGFRGLHEVNAMHRDFKLANVLLHQGVCKIAGLDFIKQLEKGSLAEDVCGTPIIMAPQVLEGKPYGLQADIWSLGIVYYQMLYGNHPYRKAKSLFQLISLIKKTMVDYSGAKISDHARDFIQRCLTIDPKKRITWSEIYDHPLIQNEDKITQGLLCLKANDNKNLRVGVEKYQVVKDNLDKQAEKGFNQCLAAAVMALINS